LNNQAKARFAAELPGNGPRARAPQWTRLLGLVLCDR
jgi:hypothetical protein